VPPERAYRAGMDFVRRTLKETGYAVVALPLGIFWFSVLVTIYATGLGLLITFVGVPLIAVGLLLARGGAAVERGWLRWTTGIRIPTPPPRPARSPSLWHRMLALLADLARWRETLYLVLLLFSGIVLFTVAVTFWSVGLGALTAPLWWWSIPDGNFLWDGNDLDHPLEWAGTIATGIVFTAAAPWVVHALVRAQAALAQGLLGSTRNELERARAAAVETIGRDRRQIERDLHDGAQARLTAVAVQLGRARERLESGDNSAEAVELVRAAHEDAKRAIVEVRDLARGIHPAILSDRGLDAALSSLAAGSPVRVTLDTDPALRAPEPVEGAAYFVVAEALTNIARHSAADNAHVSVRRDDGALLVEVRDDGRGGAAASPGSGLTGLADRVRALGGTFAVDSPDGGPTVVTARLPCA
jgi:signal transduction histidine kinase